METNILETLPETKTHIVTTVSAVARHFHVTQPAAWRWFHLYGAPKEENGTYNLIKIEAWLTTRRALKIAREADSLDDRVEGVAPEVLAEVKKELGRFRRLAEVYKMERGEVFASAQAKMLSLGEQILDSIKEKDISKMHIRDKIKALKDITSSVGSLYQNERLENNESTSNVKIIVGQILDLKRRQAEARKNSLQGDPGEVRECLEASS